LFEDVGIAAVFVPGEIGRSGFATQIAVDALIVHEVFAGNIVGIFVCDVSHKIFVAGNHSYRDGTCKRLVSRFPAANGAKAQGYRRSAGMT
jgi:hypothetical protein